MKLRNADQVQKEQLLDLPPAGSRKFHQSTFPMRQTERFCSSALKACTRIFLWPCMPFVCPTLAELTGSEPQPTSVTQSG